MSDASLFSFASTSRGALIEFSDAKFAQLNSFSVVSAESFIFSIPFAFDNEVWYLSGSSSRINFLWKVNKQKDKNACRPSVFHISAANIE